MNGMVLAAAVRLCSLSPDSPDFCCPSNFTSCEKPANKGDVCHVVWDDSVRETVMCGVIAVGYDCSKGEPCEPIVKTVPDCGRMKRLACGPISRFEVKP